MVHFTTAPVVQPEQIYTQSAPNLLVELREEEKEIVDVPSIETYVEAIKSKYSYINNNLIKDLMSILVSLKRQNLKLSHKDRILVFSGLFGCDEKEASRIYYALKIIYRFLAIKRVYRHILSAIGA